ncbi:4-hydroxy-tetrahydrodipicolinate synthase [Devosia sp.]|uniref:4-hydroxy-tetrahydrodipicolinate synthase n=1 Tax=Devosia sp. TaxID=1871048 RepID=UPI002FCA7851
METSRSALQGIWLPLITPFRDGALDEPSLRRLVAHYAAQPLDGFILGATTGEGMSLDDDETELLVSITRAVLEAAGRHIPIYLGLSGSDTRKLVKALDRTTAWGVDGYLIACPYYTRPSQLGLFAHFSALADNTARPIIIYNIPYRTGVNLGNETMLRLAERPNIVGVKDCCADPAQSFDLVRHKPADFAVLTGEDPFYHSALTQGADGAILASAHIRTADFVAIRDKLLAGDQPGALADWQRLADLPRLLFAEPSPGAIKHWLWRAGLIDSPEMRLPMVPVSEVLAGRIEAALGET